MTREVRQMVAQAMVAKLEDLLKQATTDRSHFYVASCCREAIAVIQLLAPAPPDTPQVLVDEVLKCGYAKINDDVIGIVMIPLPTKREGDTVRVIVREEP